MKKKSEEVANLEREVAHLRAYCASLVNMSEQQDRQILRMSAELFELRAPVDERVRGMQSKIDKQSARIAKLEAEMVALRQLGAAARRYAEEVAQ